MNSNEIAAANRSTDRQKESSRGYPWMFHEIGSRIAPQIEDLIMTRKTTVLGLMLAGRFTSRGAGPTGALPDCSNPQQQSMPRLTGGHRDPRFHGESR